MNIGEAAARIRQATFDDSSFFPGLHELQYALMADHAENGGHVPTEEECTTLAMGGEDGEIPKDLQKRYPHAHQYLESLF